VESAWDGLDAGALSDSDAAGRTVLELVSAEIDLVLRVADLAREGERAGLPVRAGKKLDTIRLKLLEQAREFRDAWPWSPGAKPDDPKDAAAAERAARASPSFDALSQLAEQR
jgi:hypothetical protein